MDRTRLRRTSMLVVALCALASPALAQLRWEPVPGGPPTDRVLAVQRAEGAVYAFSVWENHTAGHSSSDHGRVWTLIADSIPGAAQSWIAPRGTIFRFDTRRESNGSGNLVRRDDIYRSLDSGRTWTLSYAPPRDVLWSAGIRSIDAGGGDTLLLAMVTAGGTPDAMGELHRSTDNGATWQSIYRGLTIEHVVASNPPIVSVSGMRNGARVDQVLAITDTGATMLLDSFRTTAGRLSSSGAIVFSGRPPRLIDGSYRAEIARRAPGSSTWEIIPGAPHSQYIVALPNGWLASYGRWTGVSTMVRVQISTDDGRTWSDQSEGLTRDISTLAYDRGYLFTTMFGTIMRASIAPPLTPLRSMPMERVALKVPARYAGIIPGDRTVMVPRGWGVKVFHAGGLGRPRFLAWGPDSVLHVALLGGGRVLALPDRDRDGVADTAIVAAEGVVANSIAFFRGAMYAAEERRVLRLVDADGDGVYESRTTFIDGLPVGGHTTRTIVFDTLAGRIYLSVGSSCNACRDSAQAVVYAFDLDGGNRRIFANGIRNAVGLTQHPTTGALWATNNGQDMQGDDVPPEWISIVSEGRFYGYPIAYSDQRYFDFSTDDQYRRLLPITAADSARVRSMPPFGAEVTAHSAPMAIEFGNPSMPPEYRTGAFVALHGSWNRTESSGHSIVQLHFDAQDDSIAAARSFVLAADSVDRSSPIWWLSPCGLESDARGNLYFSSDRGTEMIGILYPTALPGGAPVDRDAGLALEAHPNPARASTTLSFELTSPAHCTVELFDATGRLVRLVSDGRLDAGAHRIEIPTGDLPAGAYRARVVSGGVSRSVAIVVER